MSAIPSCDNCEDLNNLNKIGFIISAPGPFGMKQNYSALQLRSAQPSVNFIQSSRHMPFGMPPNGFIERSYTKPIWPKDSINGFNFSYLSATYDRTNYSIVYLIKESNQLNLYIGRVDNLAKFDVYDISSITKLQSMSIIGLFESTKPNTDIRNIFAIFKSETNNTQIVKQFQFPNAFIAQVWDC